MSIPVMHIHLSRCDECKTGEHRQPPTPHTWGAREDFAWAEAVGQEPPGCCACECAHPTPKVTIRSRALRLSMGLGRAWVWRWECPDCANCDRAVATHAAALKAGLAHRWSDDCKHRKGGKR